jgi:hypothetical protein
MDKGNVDKHRRSMSGLKVEETEKWGNATAYKRYGRPQQSDMKAKDMSRPQDPIDQPGDKTYNDVSESSWLRGGGEKGKPR